MRTFELPKSITSLTDQLQIVQVTWHGVVVHIPKFAVYSILYEPVFEQIVCQKGRKIALMDLGRYQVPILDPFRGDMICSVRYVVIISHSKGNRFGLYGYPADKVESDLYLSASHSAAMGIAKNYI